jgi:hypothetical protein
MDQGDPARLPPVCLPWHRSLMVIAVIYLDGARGAEKQSSRFVRPNVTRPFIGASYCSEIVETHLVRGTQVATRGRVCEGRRVRWRPSSDSTIRFVFLLFTSILRTV